MTSPNVEYPQATRLVVRGLIGPVTLPLLVAGATFALWWLSDRLLYIGPLDRAAFGWAVVVPAWFATPLVSAIAWRGLLPRARATSAAILGLIVGGVGAIVFWQATAFPNCQFGSLQGPEAWLGPALAIGAAVGGGLAVSSMVAARLVASDRKFAAIASGAITQAGFMLVAILIVTGVFVTMPACARPT